MAQAVQPAGFGVAAPAVVRVRAHTHANVAGWAAFLAVVFSALFGPLLILLLFSFNDSNVLAFPLEGFTIHWFVEAWGDPLLRQALLNSFIVAFVVAPLCLVLGTLAAYGLTRFRFAGRAAIGGLVSAQLFRFQRDQEEAAIDLGCSRLQVLRYVILPHIAPALAASAIFAFTWSFNNFEISFFTIGFQQTFPIWVYSSVRNPDHTAVVNAISIVISAVQVGLIYAALRLLRRGGGDEMTAVIPAEVRP